MKRKYVWRKAAQKPLTVSIDARVEQKIENKLDQLGMAMEKMKLAEYVELLNKPRRLLFINFIAGVARGIGMAVGFAILGAVMIYFLQRLAFMNIPVIGDFIAEIVRIVRTNLQ